MICRSRIASFALLRVKKTTCLGRMHLFTHRRTIARPLLVLLQLEYKWITVMSCIPCPLLASNSRWKFDTSAISNALSRTHLETQYPSFHLLRIVHTFTLEDKGDRPIL